MTGKERRWLDPRKGIVKVLERQVDRVVSRYLFPHMLRVWNPYSWLLAWRFALAEISISPVSWPREIPRLKILLLTDIHAGIFLKPTLLSNIVSSLMELQPDLVAVAGDIITGHPSDLDGFLPALAPLARAPLGAWYCYGNHDYFGGDPDAIGKNLRSIGITTLRNESVVLAHGNGSFVLGGIDDRILGRPDWDHLVSEHGSPHLLLAHHPDFFYEAASHGVALTLSGHTHGGQIRFPHGAPIVRQSQFCLDEGAYAYNSSLLIVSRGLGSVLLPLRFGADPEAILIDIIPPEKGDAALKTGQGT